MGTGSSERQLWAVTAEVREDMRRWLTDTVPLGSTNFRLGFEEAFAIFDKFATSGTISQCNSIMLFLTDGQDTSGMKIDEITGKNKQNVPIFTYSFGEGADAVLPKQIACHTKGIWHRVADGSGIADAMSSYYTYFAVAPQLSLAKNIRFREYSEIYTGNSLITACLPVYNRKVFPALLLGVTCMDLTIITPVRHFKEKPDYPAARAIMEEESKRCLEVQHSDADLENLRAAFAVESQCSADLDDDVSFSYTRDTSLVLLIVLITVCAIFKI